MVGLARQYVVPHILEFDPQTREAFLTIEDYLAQLLADITAAAGSGPGVTAHSALTGLGADDHTQYLRPAEVLEGANITIDNNGDGTITVTGLAPSAQLDDLDDVSTTGVTDGTVLQYSSALALWVPQVLTLDDMFDVSVPTTPDDKNVLAWDVESQKWYAADPTKIFTPTGASLVRTTDGPGVGRYWYGPAPDPATSEGDIFFCTQYTSGAVTVVTPPATAPTVTVT